MRHLALLAVAALSCALDVGDQAPTLNGVTWMKGDPVAPHGVVTVVEFWATWCAPCKASIPHLTKLQRQHGDKLQLVGISNEDRATVEPFLAEMGAQMGYRVGIADGPVYGPWMEGRDSIPTVFVVNTQGVVAWVGRPMAMDRPLAQIIAGTYDLATGKRLVGLHATLEGLVQQPHPDLKQVAAAIDAIQAIDPVDQQAVEIGLALARFTKDAALGRRTLERLPLAQVPPEMANSLAWDLATDSDLTRRQLDLARAFSEHAISAAPDEPSYLETRARIRYALGDIDGAIAVQRALVAALPDEEDAKQVLAYYESLAGLRAGKPAAPAPVLP